MYMAAKKAVKKTASKSSKKMESKGHVCEYC